MNGRSRDIRRKKSERRSSYGVALRFHSARTKVSILDRHRTLAEVTAQRCILLFPLAFLVSLLLSYNNNHNLVFVLLFP